MPPSTPNQFTDAPPQPYGLPPSVQQLAAGPIVVAPQSRLICFLLFLLSLKPTRTYWPQNTKVGWAIWCLSAGILNLMCEISAQASLHQVKCQPKNHPGSRILPQEHQLQMFKLEDFLQ
ncbi:uncharacterized protein [Triticum aestivum]|uniref:uncharacterized protein n=1 Tax=Triticum aestivum TaxID=4565 RepID=UPI001D00F228|nr:uncharacterized protein LOC123058648 [Triticum aestivum]